MNNQGEILCTDSNEKRTPRLQSNLENLGIDITKVQVHDWTEAAPSDWHGKFDAVLLDVPCSNTGVLRRRVDARWRLRHEDIEALTEIQETILSNVLPTLKPGGRIVYSTCSIDIEENRQLIDRFLRKNSQWKISREHSAIPFKDHTDGAYAALITNDNSE